MAVKGGWIRGAGVITARCQGGRSSANSADQVSRSGHRGAWCVPGHLCVPTYTHRSIYVCVCAPACVVYTTPVEEKSIRDYRSLRLCVRKRWSKGEMVDASIITSRNNNNVIRGKNGERCIPRYREKTSNVLGGRQLEFNG